MYIKTFGKDYTFVRNVYLLSSVNVIENNACFINTPCCHAYCLMSRLEKLRTAMKTECIAGNLVSLSTVSLFKNAPFFPSYADIKVLLICFGGSINCHKLFFRPKIPTE